MIDRCPICGEARCWPVFVCRDVPIFQALAPGEALRPEHFGQLHIVRCQGCGHLYNQAFSSVLGAQMYSGVMLSNVPVHVSMVKTLQGITDWIGLAAYANQDVVEVGGGSGHLARILARDAASVQVFEPSAGLRPAMLPESNITLIHAPFRADLVARPADLIVCRQVLEHVAKPLHLLREMRQALAPQGLLYLEVPRAEYIEEHAALFDLHYAHIQYFHERNLLRLALRAGLRPERRWYLKQSHDIGLLLSPGHPDQLSSSSARGWGRPGDLAQRLERRYARGRALLTTLENSVALYGATWPGLSVLSLFHTDRTFDMVLDDNPDYDGCTAYSRTQRIPIVTPATHVLRGLATILITAYLHEDAILGTLSRLDFGGKVMRIEPDYVALGIPTPLTIG